MRPGERKKIHPRMRGEESPQAAGGFSESESPPRARGRVFRMVLLFTAIGITPACAGKRMTAWLLQSLPAESPPRARGREHFLPVRRIEVGNHPRVRGEESPRRRKKPGREEESPPRARGRALAPLVPYLRLGITPACAGKSQAKYARIFIRRNHPRVRGEERRGLRVDAKDGGITPACAGKRVMKMRPSRVWAYPLSANFSFFFGTFFECRAIPERGARRLFGCQASGLATCYASRIQEQTIGCFTGVHCLYPTSRSLRNGTEYNRAEL